MTFDTNPDGSTKRISCSSRTITAWLSWTGRSARKWRAWSTPRCRAPRTHNDGLQGAPAHGLAVPDGKNLWSTSKVDGYAYVYSLADLKEVGRVFVGQHPEWLTFTPDGKYGLHRRGG